MTKITKEDDLSRRRAAEVAAEAIKKSPPLVTDTGFEGQSEPKPEDLPPSAKVSPMEVQMYPNAQPVGEVGVPINPIDPVNEENEDKARKEAKSEEPDAAKASQQGTSSTANKPAVADVNKN